MDNKKISNRFILKFIVFTIAFIILFFIISRVGYITSGIAMFPQYNQVYSEKTPLIKKQVIVIDAGHGGEDNGASGVNGIIEKDLTLVMSKMVGEILSVIGFDVKYTRTSDVSLGSDGKFIKRNDLLYRVKFTREFENPIFLSIHMNKFPAEKYSGAQTFYSKNNPSSKVLALKVQRVIRTLIQPQNNREIKKATSSIFVLDRLESPAILVECGFISNRNEAALLSAKDYQKKLAFGIAMGIADFFKTDE
ncbi:MAG: N-acetylmuramoyl-L-alanine amidase [Clostridia bacterium]|nr:N-acetylmuramoyl-L-alanine amidase [Clostridia bacterium]